MNLIKIFLFLNFQLQLTNCQFVSTVLNTNRYFSQNQPQEDVDFTLETSESQVHQYTLWGWIKYNGNQPGISNFLVLRNAGGTGGNFPQNNFNPNYPVCPYSQIELEQNPDLLRQEQVSTNPNCFQTQSNQSTQQNGPDILYINHDLNPGMETYSLVFLIQNGILNTGQAEMSPDGFADLQFNKNTWTYFAISCDYRSGQVVLHAKEYSNSSAMVQNKTLSINHPGFQMQKRNRIIFANKNIVPYFQTETFFIGSIAYVQIAPFFVNTLEELWTGYLNENLFQSHGVLIDFFYDIENQNRSVESYGFYKESYTIEGNFQNLFVNTKKQVGVKIQSQAQIKLGEFDLKNQEQMQPFLFSVEFEYTEPLPLNYVLLSRGEQGQNGHLKIYLFKENSGRIITMELTGRGNQVSWKSSSLLLPKERNFIYVGFVVSPADSVQALYYDSKKSINIEILSNNFQFDMSTLQVDLFKQNQFDQQETLSGDLNVYRTTIMNTASPVILKYIYNAIADQSLIQLNRSCDIRSDFYRQSFACLRCTQNNYLVFSDYSCTSQCPSGTRNGFNGVCIQCFQNQCTDFDRTTFSVKQLNKNTIQLQPTTRIENITEGELRNLFKAEIQGMDNLSDYSYETEVDLQNQTINYVFDFNRKIDDATVSFVPSNASEVKYDTQGNLINLDNISFTFNNICYVNTHTKRAFLAFAILILIFVLGSLLVLLVVTATCWSRVKYIGYYWKFWLHNWMNLQLLVFFYFVGVEQPCALREFYKVLYLVTVKWNYLFRGTMHLFTKGSFSGQLERYNAPDHVNYQLESVSAWLLANFGLVFTLHCAFLLGYIVVKAISFAKASRAMKYLVLVWEFTGFIVFFLLFHMQIFVFSTLNMKRYKNGHHIFAISLLIAILYIVVFAVFWAYSMFRMLGSRFYFEDLRQKSRFIFYLIGYKDQKVGRVYDLVKVLVHFGVAVLIGTAWGSPLLQAVLIFLLLFVLLLFAVVFRPWIWIYQMLAELVFLVFIWVVSMLYLAMASKDNQGCTSCLNREGFISWFLVILMFLAFLIATLLLLFLIFAGLFKPTLITDDKTNYMQIEVQDDYRSKQEIVNDVLTQSKIRNANGSYKDQPARYDYVKPYTPSGFQQGNEQDSKGSRFLQMLQSQQKTSLTKQKLIKNQNVIPEEDEFQYRGMSGKQNHVGMMQTDNDVSYVSYSNNGTLMEDSADDIHLQQQVLQTLRNPQRQAQEEIDFDYRREIGKNSGNSSNKFDRDVNTQTYFSSDKTTPPYKFNDDSYNPFSRNESVDFQNVQGDKNYFRK